MKALSQLFILITVTVFFSSCSSSTSIIPTSTELPSTEDNYSIIWVGSGESYAYINGEYQRSPSNDYSFEVVQRRYGNAWKSVKNMHRIHPDYDGKAGPREQTMFFAIDFFKKDGKIHSRINSSIGNGRGHSDFEFREQQFQFAAEQVSSLAPYNTFRITQHYRYEEGVLLETVELFKLKDGKEEPFAKIEEKAAIFRPQKLEKAPPAFQ